MQINELNNEQRKQMLDCVQVFESLEAEQACSRKLKGSMAWSSRGGREYLIKKVGKTTRSLGPRSATTEALLDAFNRNRRVHDERLHTLEGRLAAMAASNRELGLGRVPVTTAKILRRLGAQGALAAGVRMVGTSAILAYEAAAGVHVDAALMATGDVDILIDCRRRLKLDGPDRSLAALLRDADPTMQAEPGWEGGYRMVNSSGFAVELVRQPVASRAGGELAAPPTTATGLRGDMQPAAMEGLDVLANAPVFSSVGIDEAGYPVRLVAPDPRSMAMLKAWLSEQPERNPVKRPRDAAQAGVILELVDGWLAGMLPAEGLSHLPGAWRERYAARPHKPRHESQRLPRPTWF